MIRIFSIQLMAYIMADDSVTLSNKYQCKTDIQHVLDKPGMYIGSIEEYETLQWIAATAATAATEDTNATATATDTNTNDAFTDTIISKLIKFVPGLYKIYDEAIVNARDHLIRMQSCITPDCKQVTYIKVSVNVGHGSITIENDGNGIDIAMHPEHNVWIPELIFGHLRTSTNYDESEKKTVGGTHGFGVKLAFIWSSRGSIETVDHIRKLKYYQEFNNNLSEISVPIVTKYKGTKPYTKVCFTPDYAKLNLVNGLSEDMVALFKKRAFDICAVTDAKIKVYFNDVIVQIKSFPQYVDLYIGKNKTSVPRIYESINENWEYAVSTSPGSEFIGISIVNGICTSKNGKHVEYIVEQIVRKMKTYIETKKKIVVTTSTIKEQLMIFLRCNIVNPSFDSQTKDCLTTISRNFGSSCVVSDSFVEKLAKTGIMQMACEINAVRDERAVKKNDGTKCKTIRGIPKLTDANHAGTPLSNSCILILCEGDSAKAGVLSGLSNSDRDIIGVFPLKGKLMNVQSKSQTAIHHNEEIVSIQKILGLETRKVYTSTDGLRYGKVMILTDQDLDGSHIKGLCINLFHNEWASLLTLNGFLMFMNTPILTASFGVGNNNSIREFYNQGEYDTWKNVTNNANAWTIKYYKGLGTSTSKEFKQYFRNKKYINLQHMGATSNNAIDMAFNPKRADDRKQWLLNCDPNSYLSTTGNSATYEDFINKELSHFSLYDCERSIPNIMDGFKPSLRKILYAAFKRNLTSEIKVSQFSGYVSEHSSYHHGEVSLNQAIIGMAQTFVGSNNINLLHPAGQFGTRLEGGKDSASERYIFTHLSPITKYIFIKSDNDILEYVNDDGTIVEPKYYLPILPMILINGSTGIGTGTSTNVMCYNPLQISAYLKRKLLGTVGAVGAVGAVDVDTVGEEFIPYYEGFKGTVIPMVKHEKYMFKCDYVKTSDTTIAINELPIGTWTQEYKEYLDTIQEASANKDGTTNSPLIKGYTEKNGDKIVDVTVKMSAESITKLESEVDTFGCNGIHKVLKLCSTNSNTNMHLYDANCKLHKYKTVKSIIDAYYEVRLTQYGVRKANELKELAKALEHNMNKSKYIQEILDGSIDMRHKTIEQVNALLEGKHYKTINNSYDYLTDMKMSSVTTNNVNKLFKQNDMYNEQILILQATSNSQMWLNELAQFETQYANHLQLKTAFEADDEKEKDKGKKLITKKVPK